MLNVPKIFTESTGPVYEATSRTNVTLTSPEGHELLQLLKQYEYVVETLGAD